MKYRIYYYNGRYGGEEFVILLPGTHEEGATEIAERARKIIEDLKIKHDFQKNVRIKPPSIR